MSNADRYGNKLAEAAYFFREIAFEIDENPDEIVQYQYHPANPLSRRLVQSKRQYTD